MSILQHHKVDLHYDDGTWAEASVLRFPADRLDFADIVLHDSYIRMKDAGRLRYYEACKRGETQPVIVVWACLENDKPANQIFPDLPTTTDAGETLLSTNSFVTYVLRLILENGWVVWRNNTWVLLDDLPQPWRVQVETVLHWLTNEQRILIDVGPDRELPDHIVFNDFDALSNLIPVGRCGFVRDVAQRTLPLAVFNSTYFLLEHEDFLSHHSALGDPFGLLVQDSNIVRPPLYHRGTLWQDREGAWVIEQIGMADVALILPNGHVLEPYTTENPHGFHINPASNKPVAVYTRYFGVESAQQVLGYTPNNPDCMEYVIIDRRITGWKRGGDLLIPQNGYVLSFCNDEEIPDLHNTLIHNPIVSYRFAHARHQGMQTALGCGPILASNGDIVLDQDTLKKEQYWVNQGNIIGVVPTKYPDDIDQSRAARIGMGITQTGDWLVVAISGTSKGLTINKHASAGATLVELASALLAQGAIEAINLDGGGSVQVFANGGLFNQPGDQRGGPNLIFERMVPTVGMVT